MNIFEIEFIYIFSLNQKIDMYRYYFDIYLKDFNIFWIIDFISIILIYYDTGPMIFFIIFVIVLNSFPKRSIFEYFFFQNKKYYDFFKKWCPSRFFCIIINFFLYLIVILNQLIHELCLKNELYIFFEIYDNDFLCDIFLIGKNIKYIF